MARVVLAWVCLTVFSIRPAASATWYVDGAVEVSGDGKSWATALKTIQHAINVASDGDTVIVAPGIYVENLYFRGGNIALRSTDPLAPAVVAATILEGNQTGPVITFSGAEKETFVLAGFTIRNGKAEDGGGICGGTWDVRTHATIENNLITGNSGDDEGGGLACCDGTIRNSAVTANSAEYGGGMSYCDGTIQDNTISRNSAYAGGGLENCSGTMRGNNITDNTADYSGGGLSGCGGMIEHNTISRNSAASYGGGLCDCDAVIRNNTISENSAWGGAGLARCPGTIENNIIRGNKGQHVSEGGGLFYCHGTIRNNAIYANDAERGAGLYDCDGTIEFNTISDNTGGYGGGLCYCDGSILDNVISRNSADYGSGGGMAACGGTIRGNTISQNGASSGGGLWVCSGAIENNVIAGNLARVHAGGLELCNGIIRNNLIVGNIVGVMGGYGGGLYKCGATVQNNTICGNSAWQGGGLAACWGEITNCIVWGNTATWRDPELSESSFPTYSCIQDWKHVEAGNISEDPRFADSDYRLLPTSPCIDAGMNQDWMWEATDLDGNPRIFRGGISQTVDMGAYESTVPPLKLLKITTEPTGEIELLWASAPERLYTVWSCLDLLSDTWSNEVAVSATDWTTFWSDVSPIGRMKFYRVEVNQ